MANSQYIYRGFNIEVFSTKASFDGLWTGHYEINKLGHGIAAASLGGPHMTEADALVNAVRTAKEFIDELSQ